MTIAPERRSIEEGGPLPPDRTNWTLVVILVAIIVGLVVALIWVVLDDDDSPFTDAERISGSGNVVLEDRAVGDFDAVSLFAAGRIIITQGSESSLSVETDDNLMSYIETEVRDGTLEIKAQREGRSYNLDPTGDVVLRVGVTDLNRVEIFGAGQLEAGTLIVDALELRVMGSADVTIDGLTADRFAVEIPGHADMDIGGAVPDQSIRWLGAGNYDGSDLRSENVDIDILGAASVDVWVTDVLDVTITGAGTVQYYGTPSVDQTVTGSGSIKSLGAK